MAFNTQEQEIIRFGVQNGKSRQEVEQAIANYRTGVVKPLPTPPTPSFLERAGERITTAGAGIEQKLTEGTGSPITRGVEATAQAFNVPLEIGYEALPQPVRTGLGKVGEVIGKGFSWLTNKLADTKLLKDIGELEAEGYVDTSKLREVLGTASAGGQIAGDILVVDQATKAVSSGVKTIKTGVEKVSTKLGEELNKVKLSGGVLPESSEIMNRVARLKPKDFNDFNRIAGETPGEYLTRTGNFGSPDKIITREAQKFTNSVKAVDAEFAKMPGIFQDKSIVQALKGLYEKALNTSSGGVKSPILGKVTNWINKYKAGGLTMEDINAVKRLFEREIKLGYNKMGVNPDIITKATNVDSALRQFQFSKAAELGFKNVDLLNKQTQISKFLINKLGEQVVGQSGLNAMSLTDWIMVSGGDPTSVAGFLTKKFLSSKAVQAKIAEYLNKNVVEAPITPDVGPSQVRQLGAGTPGQPQVQNLVPIKQLPPYSAEKGVPKTSMQNIQPQSQTQLGISSPKSTITTPKIKIGGKSYTLEDINAAGFEDILRKLSPANRKLVALWDDLQNAKNMLKTMMSKLKPDLESAQFLRKEISQMEKQLSGITIK